MPRPLGFLRSIDRPRARQGIAIALMGMVALSGYGTLVPADVRCGLPGAVGCTGGVLGPTPLAGNSTLEMFFNVTMYDYGFWIINTVDGTNESGTWTVYEGWTVHVNATSLKADASVGGSAYHGIGVELNATGAQLLSLAAPVGRWVSSSFVAPSKPYYHQHVWCTIECGNGHSNMYVYDLNVVSSAFIPTVTASASPTSGAAPLAVTFVGTVQGGTAPYTSSWNFGDGSATVSGLNASHTYTLGGTYSAALSVTDGKGYKASGSVSVKVTSGSALTVSVSAQPTTGYAPVETTLAATASGGVAPYTYSWSLGDGASAPLATVSHLYTAPGVYSAAVTVTDSTGASASGQASISVAAPTGKIGVAVSASPSSGSAPLGVTLTASPVGGSAPYTTSWIFGDGTVGSGSATTHSYTSAGVYQVWAFVSDPAGQVGSNVTSVTVSGGTSAPLSAVLTETPSSGAPPLTINASLSAVGGTGSYPSIVWTFGDGGTASGAVVTHRYPALGTYTVSATVTDTASATASASATVQVAGVVISITLNRTTGDAPFSVAVGASVIGGTGVYQPVAWAWGDGSSSTGNSANHTYSVGLTGNITIGAVVTDSAGQRANASATVRITPPPTASVVAVVPPGAQPPVSVNFTLSVVGGTGHYSSTPLWAFGDATSTRASSPVNHTYARPGHYLVTVTTNDSSGMSTNATTWVNITTGGLAGGIGLGGGASSWVFTGVDNPDQAALALMGLVGLSGLALLYRTQRMRSSKAKAAAAPPARAPPASAAPRLVPRPAPVVPKAASVRPSTRLPPTVRKE